MQHLAATHDFVQRVMSIEPGHTYFGRLVALTENGRPLVDFPGNPSGPISARCTVTEVPPLEVDGTMATAPPTVILIFENGDPLLPVIIGFLRDTLYPTTTPQELIFDKSQYQNVRLDGKTITFDARDEIELRCGKSSILLTKNGRIVVRGTEIVSRASRTNKIKGASVEIN